MGQFTSAVKRIPASVTITAGAGATTSATPTSVNCSGLLQAVNFTTPATVDSAATITLTITDQDGYVIYTSAATAAGTAVKDTMFANAVYKGPIPVSGVLTFQTTYSAAQTVHSSTTAVTLLVQG